MRILILKKIVLTNIIAIAVAYSILMIILFLNGLSIVPEYVLIVKKYALELNSRSIANFYAVLPPGIYQVNIKVVEASTAMRVNLTLILFIDENKNITINFDVKEGEKKYTIFLKENLLYGFVILDSKLISKNINIYDRVVIEIKFIQRVI